MKKWILALVMVCLCLTGCSGRTGAMRHQSPEAAAESMMQSLKSLDLEAFNDCTDNLVSRDRSWLGFTTAEEYRVFNRISQTDLVKGKRYEADLKFAETITENLSWEIKDVKRNGDKAKVYLAITNTDMTDVTGNYMIHVMEKMIASDDTGLKQLIKDLSGIEDDKDGMQPYLEAAKGDKTMAVTVSAKLEDHKWIFHISDAFINGFMGNLNTEHFSKDVENRLEELEDQYEQKMEQWGDDFEDKVDNWLASIFGE